MKLNNTYTRALLDAKTFDKEKRTIEVYFATETPVRRNTWDGPIDEVLSLENSHVRMERINSGAPVLNNHDSWTGIESMLGVVERAWIEGGKGRALLRFSERDEIKSIIADIENGIIRNVSVGYRVYKYQKEETDGSTAPVYRAIDWEPYEISMVPVPADFNSHVRGNKDEAYNVEIINSKTDNSKTHMKREQIIATLTKRGITVPDNATDEDLLALLERSIPSPAPAPPAPAPGNPMNEEQVRKAAIDAERGRVNDIVSAVRTAKLEQSFADKLITEGTSVDEARKLIIDELAKQDPNVDGKRTQIIADEKDKKREAIELSIAHRAMPGLFEIKDEARNFRGLSLIDLAKDLVEADGTSTRGWTKEEIAKTALGIRGMHSTSDFPIILGNTVNRTLRKAYEMQERTFLPFVSRGNASDFKEMTRAQLGEGSNFDEVKEGGEYKFGTMGEGKEVYAVKKYGKMYAITWEMIINDDLSAFNRIPRNIAMKAAQKQSDIVYAILTGNPKMGDNVDLFHSSHGNLTGTGTAISAASLGKMRELMRKQKGVDAKDFINVTPKFLIVAPEKEFEAFQYTSSQYTPNTSGGINPSFNTQLQTIVEPRLSALNNGLSWFGAADPNMIDTIEIAFLEGNGELFTEQRVGFDVDGLEIKARMVFGAKAIDWRGLYKNVGA